MRGVTIAPGVTAATFAAGPLLLPIGVTAEAATEPAHGLRLDQIAGFVPGIPLAALFGAFLAFVPNLAGAVLLGALGRGNVGVRLPACLALVGGGTGGLIGAGAGPVASLVMATVGTFCALICRWGTDWHD